MKKNTKKYLSLVFSMASVFMLGAYSASVAYNIKEVEPQQWFLTSIFGIMFLIYFLSKKGDEK